jgi:hypothetical protein
MSHSNIFTGSEGPAFTEIASSGIPESSIRTSPDATERSMMRSAPSQGEKVTNNVKDCKFCGIVAGEGFDVVYKVCWQAP